MSQELAAEPLPVLEKKDAERVVFPEWRGDSAS